MVVRHAFAIPTATDNGEIVLRLRDFAGMSRFATLVAVHGRQLTVRRDDGTIDCIGPDDVIKIEHPGTQREP
jgi:hypothetical protein